MDRTIIRLKGEEGGDDDGDDPMAMSAATGDGGGDDDLLSGKGLEIVALESSSLDTQKVTAMIADSCNESCPSYLSNLNWFLLLGGVAKFGARLAARDSPPKATIVRGLVEILCMVAEVVSSGEVVVLLRDTLTNLEKYVAGVPSDDLKRSPENRAALFSAMDHVR